jgi:hypothetical protein
MIENRQATVAHSYALRIEGMPWLDDLSIEQVWAVLRAAYQTLDQNQELLFMMLLPSGDMPAKCLPKSLFESCITTPELLKDAMRATLLQKPAQLSLIHDSRSDEHV